MSTEADLLLGWVTSQSAGSWPSLKDRHDWLFGRDATRPAWVTASTLIALGHVEVDYRSSRFEVAPPTLVALPDSACVGVLAGARSDDLIASVVSLDRGRGDRVHSQRVEQEWAPAAYFIFGDDWASLVGAAMTLGVRFEPRFANRVASALPMIAAEGSPTRPPTADLERFDAESARFRRTTTLDAFGLYRLESFGPPRYFWHDGVGWRPIDLDVGRYLELRRTNRQVIRFERSGSTGSLFIEPKFPLPAMQARVATLCSGLVPEYHVGSLRYHNVTKLIATEIARSLGQSLRDRRGAPM